MRALRELEKRGVLSMSELEIVEVKGGRGKTAWDMDALQKIEADAYESLKKNNFAIVELKELEKAYKGTGSEQYNKTRFRRKLEDMFPGRDIQYFKEIRVKDKKNNSIITYQNVFLIK